MADSQALEGGEPGEISFQNGDSFHGGSGECDAPSSSNHINGHSKSGDRTRSTPDHGPSYTITVSDVSQQESEAPERHAASNGTSQSQGGSQNMSSLSSSGLQLPSERSVSPYRDPSRDHSESPRPSASPGSSNNSFPSYDWETLDPESNLYIANFPNDYGEENLRRLFSRYGPIARAKFVPVHGQRAYGFVQFVNVEDSHRALKEMDGYRLNSGEQLFMSVALRKRSSLSEEPTNLYVKNIPESWTYHELNVLFGPHGRIVQSRVAGDRIAFVRYETHYQAIKAIDNLNGVTIEGAPAPLEVKFANRKRAVKEYNNPTPVHKSNSNNLYVRGLPPSFAQIQLEELFAPYGTVSSTRMFPNGVAFVRFAERGSALTAIQSLHNRTIPGCTTPLTVKLAYFDIGDSRNRTWKNDRSNDNEPRERPSRSNHHRSNHHHHRPQHHHRQHASHHPHHQQHQQHQQHDRMPTGAFSKNVFQGSGGGASSYDPNNNTPQLVHSDYYHPYNTTTIHDHQPHFQGSHSAYGNGVTHASPGGPADVVAAAGPYAMAPGIPTAQPTAAAYPYGGLTIIPPTTTIPVSSSPGLTVPTTLVSPPSPGVPAPLTPQQQHSSTGNVAVAAPPISPLRQHGASSAPVGVGVYPPNPFATPTIDSSGLVQPFGSMSMATPMMTSPDGQAIYAAQPMISPMPTVQPAIYLTPQTAVPTGSSPQTSLPIPSPQSAAGISGSVTPSRTMPTTNLGTTVVQQQQRQFSEQQRRQGDIIYQIISESYPKYASKVTGMILNLGEAEAENLLARRDELDKKVKEAVTILQAVEHQHHGMRLMANGGAAGQAGDVTIAS